MIAVVKKGNNARGIINYHEAKVSAGKAIRIEDTTFSGTKHARIKTFEDHALLNKRVRKDKFSHISISFPSSENISQDQKILIADRYLELMGYVNAPKLIYQHTDTGFDHFHIITSTIAFDGKKINTFRDHYRSQEVSRRIETEFGLSTTQYEKGDDRKLQELNASKYGISKSLKNLKGNPGAMKLVNKILTEKEVETILRNGPPDSEITNMLQLREITSDGMNELFQIFQKHNALYKTDKQMLIDRLRTIKNKSNNIFEFQHNCRKDGIYVRQLNNDKGATVTYGLPEHKFYIRDTKLPSDLRLASLFSADRVFDRNAQLKFLRRMITRHLKRSKTIEQFKTNLDNAGIEYTLSSNAGGIYGISFRSKSIKNGQLVKGSDVGLSWQTINKALEANNKSRITYHPPKRTSIPTNAISRLGHDLDTSREDESERERKTKTNGL